MNAPKTTEAPPMQPIDVWLTKSDNRWMNIDSKNGTLIVTLWERVPKGRTRHWFGEGRTTAEANANALNSVFGKPNGDDFGDFPRAG